MRRCSRSFFDEKKEMLRNLNQTKMKGNKKLWDRWIMWLKQLEKKWLVGLVLLMGTCMILFGILQYTSQGKKHDPMEEWLAEEITKETGEEREGEGEENPPEQSVLYVDIKGAVREPGVYQIEAGRVIDAIRLAGGLTEQADENQLNLALKLVDQMVIYVPVQGESGDEQKWQPSDSSDSKEQKININTASEEELKQLDGIGPSKSAAIISYREEHGAFKKIEDIKQVSGIGEKTFEKFKEKIETED